MYEGKDRVLKSMVDWLNEKCRVDLGNMRHILSRVRSKPDHPVIKSLLNFVQKLPNKEFLLSESLQSIVVNISQKYRNSGVHDSMVSFEVCNEAFQAILIEKGGALKLLLGESV